MEYNYTLQILQKYKQEHLLNFYNELTKEQQEKLLNDIASIDYEQIKKLYENRLYHEEAINNIEPIKVLDETRISKEDKDRYIDKGIEIIKSGKYAVATMAGGQGTRLGHNGPKGTFMLGINQDKSLFEISCDKLKMASQKYGTVIPWYIMTSKENNTDTIKFFEENNYFNYPKEYIKFFMQGELPVIDSEGKIILESKYSIKQAADGNGGIFEAMRKNNIIEDMKDKNVEWVFIGPIDNPLVPMTDTLLLGYSVANNYMAASKTVIKCDAKERVGTFCKKNGRPAVVEYTEISEKIAEMVDENNELIYGDAHLMLNLFNIKVIEEISKEKLPYHIAYKKCNYINQNGELIIATESNSYKFEAFIFDAFLRLNDIGLIRGKREEIFAPVKNKEGVDSPETARKLYINYMNKNFQNLFD